MMARTMILLGRPLNSITREDADELCRVTGFGKSHFLYIEDRAKHEVNNHHVKTSPDVPRDQSNDPVIKLICISKFIP